MTIHEITSSSEFYEKVQEIVINEFKMETVRDVIVQLLLRTRIIIKLSGDMEIMGVCVWDIGSELINIMFLTTVKEHRKQGVANGLLNWMINTFPKHTMYLHVSVRNENAIKLYMNHGFCIYHTILNYYKDQGEGIYTGDGMNAYVMMKKK